MKIKPPAKPKIIVPVVYRPAYQGGWDAYRETGSSQRFPTQGEDKNHYHPNSSDYWDWVKGWNDRCFSDAVDETYQESYGGG